MQTTNVGIALIQKWEGYREKAYGDVGGVCTIGWGHTANVCKDDVIDKETALAYLKEDLKHAERAINKNVEVDLSPNQFDALVSWAFNVGQTAVKNSTLVKLLNENKYHLVPEQLARWNKVKGKPVSGLIKRRAAEAVLWNT
jgi:lysozyme